LPRRRRASLVHAAGSFPVPVHGMHRC